MTLRQLEYIVALDTHRSFSRAAAHCFVAQPTLTLQVKKLEDEIGAPLFNRSTQPIVPTPIGHRFLLKARHILREVESLRAMLDDDRNSLKGTFRIGVIPTLAPYVLPRFVKQFSDAHPDIHLEIKELQSAQIIEKLLHNELDIGLMVTPLSERQIREIPLFYEPFLLYANPTHSILQKEHLRAGDLDEKGLWLLDEGHCFRSQVLQLCKHDRELQATERIAFQSGSIETLKNMIQNHSGYTLIPELAVEDRDMPYTRRFEEPQPAREVSLVVHQAFTKELLLKNLREDIVAQVPKSFKMAKRFMMVEWR